jgi:hypothetical protein
MIVCSSDELGRNVASTTLVAQPIAAFPKRLLRRPKGGQRSLRKISAALASRGFLNERAMRVLCGFNFLDACLTAKVR